jgi:hypothetical protein
MRKLVLHSKFKVGGSSLEYVEMRRTVDLSDNAILTPNMILVKGDLRITLENLVWDEDQQEYQSYIPVFNIDQKDVLKKHIDYSLAKGWWISYQTKGIEL